MPRSSNPRVFKKRKNVGLGKPRLIDVAESPRCKVSPKSSPVTDDDCCKSSSNAKLTPNLCKYDCYGNSDSTNIIISSDILKEIVSDIAVCRKCGADLCITVNKSFGLASELQIECEGCNLSKKYLTSSKVTSVKENGEQTTSFDINIRYVYGLRSIGKGPTAGRMLAGIMNLPSPPQHFIKYTDILGKAVKNVCLESMNSALEEAVEKNDNNRDISIALDGTWQKRGHTSQNGIISATSFDTGKVIDISVLSKFCKCKQKNENIHSNTCTANYSGVSGGMEIVGVREIFERSIEREVRYAFYLGDGDSKAFQNVVDAKIYGDEFQIQKLECCGHVQKRMGTRLRTLKQKMKTHKLKDKKPLSGKGRLTDSAILHIQNYYGLAIRRNKGDLQAMKQDIWAEFFHIGSTNENPNHGLCPKGDITWCKYQLAKSLKLNYDHNQHFHLPPIVMDEIKPIFRDLAKPDLLRKCLHGKTQNPNESLNNVIWARLPKSNFVGLKTLCFGTYDAVTTFNEGNIAKCQVLKYVGIDPGINCVEAMKSLDAARVRKGDREASEIQKKARQSKRVVKRKLEEDMEEIDNEERINIYSDTIK